MRPRVLVAVAIADLSPGPATRAGLEAQGVPAGGLADVYDRELAALTRKPKKKAKGEFDSPAIVALITTASEPMTAAEVAEAMGIELTGALKTRLNLLATRDQVIALIPGAT